MVKGNKFMLEFSKEELTMLSKALMLSLSVVAQSSSTKEGKKVYLKTKTFKEKIDSELKIKMVCDE